MHFSDIYGETHLEASTVAYILLWPVDCTSCYLKKIYISDSCPLITVNRMNVVKIGELIDCDFILFFHSIIG